ncbi:hypothetical protein B0919_16530 [Hymenobacter sp. CRA2]|nr:hypothetical protein B0919_16530 [Hymenobacter sp. CRA2]
MFFCLAWGLGLEQARASHALGGELTYEYIGTAAQPNRYRITCRYFRDCSGIAAETDLLLTCRVGSPTTSCTNNDSRNFTTTLTRGQLISGSPYCSSVAGANQCDNNSLYPNYETARYTAEVTLPGAPEWTLSVEINARPVLENLTSQNTLRFEATINNQLTLANGQNQLVTNTSPQYQNQDVPVPFVCFNQQNTLTFSAFEPDGDSLVYSLERPLEGCNTFSAYAPTQYTGPIINSPACVTQLPSPLPAYSAIYPIQSFNITGTCPVMQGTPYFAFNPRLGSMTFTPGFFSSGTASNQGRNKYVIVGKVTEYRKIGGRYYKVGSVRRDMLVIVVDCAGNQVPANPVSQPVVQGSGTVAVSSDSILVSTPVGQMTEVDLRFSDPNGTDLLSVTYVEPTDADYPNMYINLLNPARPVTLQGNGTTSPVLKIRLRPDPSLLGRKYRIPVRVEDNACPIKGVQYRILVLSATRTGQTTAVAAGKGRTVLSGYPNPFTDRVTFSLPRQSAAANTVLVLDQLGRVVDRLPVAAGASPDATLTWAPAASVPAGVYSVRFADGRHTVRLVRTAH